MNTTKSPLCASVSASLLAGVVACGAPAPDLSATTEQPVASATGHLGHGTPMPAGVVSGTYPGASKPKYNNGPLLTGTIPVVPIFYGTAWQPGYQATILSYLSTMSASSYWQVVEEYADTHGNRPGAISVLPAVYDTTYSYGTNLSDGSIEDIAQDASTHMTSPSANTVFLVFTADDVAESGASGQFCNDYFGWHAQNTAFRWENDNFVTSTYTAQYAFVGSPQRCVSLGDAVPASDGGSVFPWAASVNGTVIDEAVLVVEHELAEAATDPDMRTGVNPEIGDICAWVPGPTGEVRFAFTEYDLGAGVPYNAGEAGYASNLGNKYLVQTIWDMKQGACAYGPTSLDCSSALGACGSAVCGTASNGCGGTVSCGTCPPVTETCQAGACVPKRRITVLDDAPLSLEE